MTAWKACFFASIRRILQRSDAASRALVAQCNITVFMGPWVVVCSFNLQGDSDIEAIVIPLPSTGQYYPHWVIVPNRVTIELCPAHAIGT